MIQIYCLQTSVLNNVLPWGKQHRILNDHFIQCCVCSLVVFSSPFRFYSHHRYLQCQTVSQFVVDPRLYTSFPCLTVAKKINATKVFYGLVVVIYNRCTSTLLIFSPGTYFVVRVLKLTLSITWTVQYTWVTSIRTL